MKSTRNRIGCVGVTGGLPPVWAVWHQRHECVLWSDRILVTKFCWTDCAPESAHRLTQEYNCLFYNMVLWKGVDVKELKSVEEPLEFSRLYIYPTLFTKESAGCLFGSQDTTVFYNVFLTFVFSPSL